MNTLKPIIFLFPVIALVLVSLLYLFLANKTTDKQAFKWLIFRITTLAFVLNLTWELIQMPLYNPASFEINHVLFCVLGSVADAIMVLLIYFVFAALYKNPFWIKPPQWQRIVMLVATGGTGAILSEIRHLSLGNWGYSNLMPLIPYLNVGLSPVLQFMILPSIIYFLSFWGFKKYLP